jgi:hypothetical protein
MAPGLKPQTPLEEEIFDLWQEIVPAAAYTYGLTHQAGTLFIPRAPRVEEVVSRIDRLIERAEHPAHTKFLASLRRYLTFLEPPRPVDNILDAIFAHLIKEGVVKAHIESLLKYGVEALKASLERLGREWPLEIRILTQIRGRGLSSLLETLTTETGGQLDPGIVEGFRAGLQRYLDHFQVQELGDFEADRVLSALREDGGDIGRQEIYPDLLKEFYDFPESPAQIEAKALEWLAKERPLLDEVTELLADRLGVAADVATVSQALAKRANLRPETLLNAAEELRSVFLNWAEQKLVDINPHYDTRLIETPPYLTPIIPSGAAAAYDALTDHPFQLFFLTTDVKRSPPTDLADLLQLIVHEETGHCVHFSNSATAYAANPGLTDILASPLGLAAAEAIAFWREMEFIELYREALEGDRAGKPLIRYIGQYTDPQELLVVCEFTLAKWRTMRFLRAIGDVRINLGRVGVAEFIEWAAKETGLPQTFIYDQIFPTFQAEPGYAPTYSMAGQELGELQARWLKGGGDRVEFNTYVSSLGFPARTLFMAKVREFVGRRA